MIIIHALGSSILKAVKLALKIEEIYAGITFTTKTSTVNLIDDIKEEEKEVNN